jgi:hypothetical protein
VPPADTPLDEAPHPLLTKASERFADDQTPQERIASIDDQVLLKVKVQRWRGAVWIADDGIPWLVAAGQREEGSPDDFYASLAARGKAARSQYNAAHAPPLTTETYTSHLLPGREDELRWKAEHAVRAERRLRVTVHSCCASRFLTGASTPRCWTERPSGSRSSPIRVTRPTSRCASSAQFPAAWS